MLLFGCLGVSFCLSGRWLEADREAKADSAENGEVNGCVALGCGTEAEGYRGLVSARDFEIMTNRIWGLRILR